MITFLPSSPTASGRPVRIPVPHSLRKAIPSSDLAEATWVKAIERVGIPSLDLTRLSDVLKGCEGHAILGAPRCWTDAQLRWAYIAILHNLGDLNGQNGQLLDMEDFGYEKCDQTPALQTASVTRMRTDSTDARYNPDLVAFLCLQPGSSGNRSLLANAAAVLGRLRQIHPELEQVARKPWPCDGNPSSLKRENRTLSNNAIPIFSEDSNGFVFRYTRHSTERALAKLGRPVPTDLKRLFDFIDADVEDHAIRFPLHRGDMLFVNNRTMAHGREARQLAPCVASRLFVCSRVDGFLDSHSRALSRRA